MFKRLLCYFLGHKFEPRDYKIIPYIGPPAEFRVNYPYVYKLIPGVTEIRIPDRWVCSRCRVEKERDLWG